MKSIEQQLRDFQEQGFRLEKEIQRPIDEHGITRTLILSKQAIGSYVPYTKLYAAPFYQKQQMYGEPRALKEGV